MSADDDYEQFIANGRRWRELLPEGRYAWPLYDMGQDDVPLIGHCVYWKRRQGGMTTTLRLADNVESTPGNQQLLWEANRTDENGDDEYRLACIVECPGEYAGTYGMFSGHCGICGRPLTDPQSRELGLGPDCIKKLAVQS